MFRDRLNNFYPQPYEILKLLTFDGLFYTGRKYARHMNNII